MTSTRQWIPILKRTALWHAHTKRCAYCRLPLKFGEMHVDHVLPQRLLEEEEILASALQELNLPSEFNLLDYGNWLPSHGRCNLQKGQTVFERGASAFFLSIARSKVDKARKKEMELKASFKTDDLLSQLQLGIERGLVKKDQVLDALEAATPQVQSDTDPLVLSFSVNALELTEDGSLPPETPRDQISRDDWLERQLEEHIHSIVSSPFFYPEPSQRTGETVSVRIAILDSDESELEKLSPDYWELLDIDRYSLLYHYLLAASGKEGDA